MNTRSLSLFLLALVLASCSSAPRLIDPEIFVRAVGGTPPLRSGMSYAMTFEVIVTNRSSEPITLERVQLQTTSSFSYDIRSRTEMYRELIQPGETKAVAVYANAYVNSARTAESEPITLRVSAFFNSPLGRFRRIVTRNLASGIGDPR